MLRLEMLHPLIVHFPIVLLYLSFLFFLVARLKKDDALQKAGAWTLVLGAVAACAALGSGLLAEENAIHNEAAHEIIEHWHEPMAYAVVALSVLLSGWGLAVKWRLKGASGPAFLVAHAVMLVCLTIGGHFGATMVYQTGMGVSPDVLKPMAHEHHHGEDEDEHGAPVDSDHDHDHGDPDHADSDHDAE